MELAGLKNELRHLLVIAQQLEPYIRSISSLMERIQPQVGATQDEVEDDDSGQGYREHDSPVAVPVSQSAGVKTSEAYQSSYKNHEPESPSPSHISEREEERIIAILDRIQAMKR